MVNYRNSKIYKLIDNTNGNIYIGSTTTSLSRRLVGHRGHYKDYLNKKSNCRRKCISSIILDNNDYRIILIEEYPCDSREQLLKKEQYYIDKFNCINTIKAFQSVENRKLYLKEKRLNNIEYRKNQDKEKYKWITSWGTIDNSLIRINPSLFY